jgi:hypothetical protein
VASRGAEAPDEGLRGEKLDVTLRVVGAGLGRTGTLSLKHALETLLCGPCYHMTELFGRPADVPTWHAAVRGEPVDWSALFADHRACVDWPGAGFWTELHDAFPDALVVLSLRDPESWWRSASETIFPRILELPADAPPHYHDWHRMVTDLIATRFDGDPRDAASSMAAFEAHNERVRRAVPAEHLLEWRAADGWDPLCAALGVAVPDEPFPRVNTREEFLGRTTS